MQAVFGHTLAVLKGARRRLRKLRLPGLFFIAFAAYAFIKIKPDWHRHVQDALFDVSVFIYSWVEKPVVQLSAFKQRLERQALLSRMGSEWDQILQDHQRLTHEVDGLRQENRYLKHILKFQEPTSAPYMVVPCLGALGANMRHALLIQRGTVQGLYRRQPVFYQEQLIGQIDRVTKYAATILLINDPLSRVPVVFEQTQSEGILSGLDTGELVIIYRNQSRPVQVGEKIFTSGLGGVFPAHKYVGHVARIVDDRIYIENDLNFESLRYVQIPLKEGDDNAEALRDEIPG